MDKLLQLGREAGSKVILSKVNPNIIVHITRPGNILRFPWAAGEPPQSYRSCGVSPMPILPQESPYISGANMMIVRIYNL